MIAVFKMKQKVFCTSGLLLTLNHPEYQRLRDIVRALKGFLAKRVLRSYEMRAVTTKDLQKQLACSRMTVTRMREANELPPPIPTSRRLVRWLASDIDLWFELGCPPAAEFTALKKTKQKFARR